MAGDLIVRNIKDITNMIVSRIGEIKMIIASECNVVIYRNRSSLKSFKNPCMLVMFGGDPVATSIASKIGIDLNRNDVASIAEDHTFWLNRISDISVDSDTRSYIEKDTKDGCVRIISVGMGVFMVYDQNMRHVNALFN